MITKNHIKPAICLHEILKNKSEMLKGMTSKCCDKNKQSVVWLRKQRDSLIGAIEDDIKKLKKRTDKIKEETDEITKILKELVELNDEIYHIEYSIEDDEDISEDSSEEN